MPPWMTQDRMPQLLAGVEALTRAKVLVGVPAANAGRDDGAPINNAAIAYIHEHGAPRAHIPPRPFMEPGVREGQERIIAGMKAAADAALKGDQEGVTKRLHRVGLVAVSAIRMKIRQGPFLPLSETTLAKRKARGVTREKPLIDTGNLIKAISYVLRGRG